MKKRRLLAWLMTLVMMIGLMPATAFAAEAGDDYVSASKTAERVGENTWEITMQVTAKGKDVKPEPLELVILMDTSYSMQWDVNGNQWWVDDEDRRITIAGDAAKQLIADLAKDNINAKVAVYKFDATAHKISGLTQLTSNNLSTIQGDIPDSIRDLSSQYGTNITAGLRAAAGSDGNPVFSGTTDNKVIVLLGDGDPYNDTDGEDGPNADTIKAVKEQGITVHTIGFAQHVAALERIAKGTGVGDKTGKYYTANDAKELAAAFKQIKDSLTAMIVDNMSSSAGSDVTFKEIVSGNVSETDNGFNWNPAGGVLEAGKTATIKYTVTADPDDFDTGSETIKLNGTTVLSYETTQGEKGSVSIPAPTADVKVVQVVEHYMLDGEEEDKETHDKFFVYGDNGAVVVDADATSEIPETATYMGSDVNGTAIEVDDNGQATIDTTAGGTFHVYHNYVSVAAPTVTKTADKTTAKQGDTINYTVIVTNNDVATRDFAVTDTFFNNSITVQKGTGEAETVTLTDNTYNVTLAPDETVTITYAYEVTANDAGNELENTVSVTVEGNTFEEDVTVEVEANEGVLNSEKFVATAKPTLTSGKVPADIAYAYKSGDIFKVDLPENESVKVLFGITVENKTTSGLGVGKTVKVADTDAEYVGYATTATEGVTVEATDVDEAEVTLAAGKTVTLYFVMEIPAHRQTFTNTASVDGDPVTATVQIGEKSTMLTILKNRIAEEATVEFKLPEGVDLGEATPNYEPTPVIDFTDGEVTLLYKVTVENTDDNISTSNIMFFNTTEPEGLQYVVTDEGAEFVGYDTEDSIEEDALPVADTDTEEVTGYLKYGQKVDLYFVRTFTADEILAAGGNAVNTATLSGADEGTATETTDVTVNVTYTLNYNANAGDDTVTYMPDPATVTAVTNTATHSFTVSAAVPERAGYTFLGWATTEDATVPDVTGGKVDLTSTDREATLFAVWEVANVTYTLNYNANAGTDTVTNMPEADTFETNTGSHTFTVSGTVPVRTGYTFQGWATTADATIANATTVTVTDPATSATVYAVWKPNDLAITFDSNAGVLAPYVTGEMAAQTVQYNVAEALNANQFELGGYRFNGWNTQADGKGTPYADGADIKVTSDTRLYAQWSVITPDRVTLTYHVNYEGYTGTIKEVKDTYNVGEIGMVRNAATFTAPEGKRFVAWNTKADGTGTSYDPANLMTNNIQVFENTDLYAIWRDLQRDIDVTKTSNVTTARRNTWVEYTITVTNTGEMKLDGVVVTETPDATVFSEGEFVNLPDGVNFVEDSNDKVKITELGVDGTVTLTYKALVKSNAQKNATLVNTVVAEVPNGPKDEDKLEKGTVYVPSSGGGSSSKKDKEIVAGDVEEILNTEDHFQYVQGYPDATVGPERNITRAEATVIFFRLLQDHVREELLTAENEFPDVKLEDWFNLGVSTMEYGGFVSGYEDGYFRPNGYITRAELATIISNFDDLEPVEENKFADVEGHWAEKYVNSAAAKGWISGYDDGLFRPNQYITRAETMSMINRVLNRKVDAAGLHADAKQWKDNVEGQWYYYAVLEATNHHDYQRADVKDAETWTAINPNKVWEN